MGRDYGEVLEELADGGLREEEGAELEREAEEDGAELGHPD